MDITEAIIDQHFYWPRIRKSVQKEVTNGETCQRKKQSKIKYSKLQAEESEEIIWNKICVDILGP